MSISNKIDADLAAGGPAERNARPFVLFDTAGVAWQPVRHFNGLTGRSAFRIKTPDESSRKRDADALDTPVDVARAMLLERRPVRVRSVNEGGPVRYYAYPAQLVRYELDPRIAAALGVPPRAGG